MPPPNKISSINAGVAGEYFVAAELSKRGYIASITLRNTKGIDILATNAEATKSVNIQVKTSQGKSRNWILNKKAETYHAPDLFYVFVNLRAEMDRPEFFIVPSKVVAKFVKRSHAEWLSGSGRNGRKRKDTPIRQFVDETDKYFEKWELLGLGG
jgi:hypothetical protein